MGASDPHSHACVFVAMPASHARRTFSAVTLTQGGVDLPRDWPALRDVRIVSAEAGQQLVLGEAPARTQLGRFDPDRGPFSVRNALTNAWAQSFEFMRDLQGDAAARAAVLTAWLPAWGAARIVEPARQGAGLLRQWGDAKLSEHLVWCGRRVMNWLSHIVPLAQSVDAATADIIWTSLCDDLNFLTQHQSGRVEAVIQMLHPISHRAQWTSACALCAVEACVPGLLEGRVKRQAIDMASGFIGPDGMFLGGSPLATLSAGADLVALEPVVGLRPAIERVRQAIACVRRQSGNLVTFAHQPNAYRNLIAAVLGPGPVRAQSLLSAGGVARYEAGQTCLWVQTGRGGLGRGAAFEYDYGGETVFEGFNALAFEHVLDGHDQNIRRRDDRDTVTFEAAMRFEWERHKHNCVRSLVSADHGRKLTGEDAIFGGTKGVLVKNYVLVFSWTSGADLQIDAPAGRVSARLPATGQVWNLRVPGMHAHTAKPDHPIVRRLGLDRKSVLFTPSGKALQRDVIIRWDASLQNAG